jgi:hypothetical protein
LLFHPTNNRFEIESLLIQELVPAWNRSRGKASVWVDVKDGGRDVNKYEKLGKYLANSNKRLEELTYDAMEKIVGVKFPYSAYHYRTWWANSGQSHSKTWSTVGWKVSSVKLGESVIFEKNVNARLQRHKPRVRIPPSPFWEKGRGYIM